VTLRAWIPAAHPLGHRLAEADDVQEVGRASLDMAHGHLPGRFRPPLQH
jgi:hypothetical protein